MGRAQPPPPPQVKYLVCSIPHLHDMMNNKVTSLSEHVPDFQKNLRHINGVGPSFYDSLTDYVMRVTLN